MSILITAATTAQAYQLKNKLEGKNIILGDHMDLPDFCPIQLRQVIHMKC